MTLSEIKEAIGIEPYYEEPAGVIYCSDCLDILLKIPEKSIDLVVTDPPYNFTTASAGCGKLSPWPDLCNAAHWFTTWIGATLKILKYDGAMWEFCNWRSIPTVMKAVFDAQSQIESLLVWDKEWIGPGGMSGLRPSYELVALIRNQNFTIGDRGIPDIKRSKWSSIKPSGHPAEKPYKLLEWLIEISGGDLILDPFLGSGTTAVAAKQLGRKFIGIEIEEKYCEIAKQRLAQEELF